MNFNDIFGGLMGGSQAGGAAGSAGAAAGGGGGGLEALLGGFKLGGDVTKGILDLLDMRTDAKIQRRTSRGLRNEARGFSGELFGMPGGRPMDPQVAQTRSILGVTPQFTQEDIKTMMAAQRLMRPGTQRLTGPVSGWTAMRGLPIPSSTSLEFGWKTPTEIQAANVTMKQQSLSNLSSWLSKRYAAGASMVR